MRQQLPDWSDLSDDLRIRVQQQTPERHALWAELRASADSPAEFLESLASTDRLHGDLGLELGTVGAAFAHRWEPPFRGGAPPKRLTMGPVQKNQSTSE